MNVELVVDAADVIADGIDTDLELIGGARVAVTLRKQFEKTYFLLRELLIEFLWRAGLLKYLDHLARDFR